MFILRVLGLKLKALHYAPPPAPNINIFYKLQGLGTRWELVSAESCVESFLL